MRKSQKKQVEDFVELLGQAHDQIEKEINKRNIGIVQSILVDCQEGAVSLGDSFSKSECYPQNGHFWFLFAYFTGLVKSYCLASQT